jgi:hypothetical protein
MRAAFNQTRGSHNPILDIRPIKILLSVKIYLKMVPGLKKAQVPPGTGPIIFID